MESQPSWQKGVVTQSSTMRTVPDVAMDADPVTGVPIFDSWDFGSPTPWLPGYEGGTSLSTPMWAGLVAIADQGRANAGLGSLDGATQTLPRLYKLPSVDFHAVTTGNNGYPACEGYNLVTGRGAPVANRLVYDLAGTDTSVNPTGPRVTPTGAAAYIGTDYKTEGNWKGTYGSQGEYIVNDSRTLPCYATLTTIGNATTYAGSSISYSALKRKSSGRIASALSGSCCVSLGLDLTDGKAHRIDVYVLDWNGRSAPSESVSVLDASTGAVLSSETVSGYCSGKYIAFSISGNVIIKVTPVSGTDATVSGLFLDPRDEKTSLDIGTPR